MTDNKVVIEAFTELAPRYEETVDQELRELWGVGYQEFINRLIETVSIGDGDIILDVATGTAQIPLTMMSKTKSRSQIIGLDITSAMLKYGLAKIKVQEGDTRIKLVCASAMSMPFANDAFDLVICGLGTHHMNVPQMLREMRRVLKTGGSLVMADVGRSPSWRSSWRIALLKILLIRYGLTRWSIRRARAEMEALPNIRLASEWHAILADLGFTKIEISADYAGRRSWYPDALFMKAVKGGSKNDKCSRIA